MSAPYFGFTFIREANEPAPPSNAIMSIVGLAGPFGRDEKKCSQEDFEAKFPYDEPVMFTTTDRTAQMIDKESFIGDALDAINNQLGRMETSARVIVVRTEEGEDEDDTVAYWKTVANIVGSSVDGTGIWAFKHCGAKVGAYPRLVCIPGYTTRRPSGIDAITVVDQGTGVASDITATVADNPDIVLAPVVEGGKVVSVTIVKPGYDLTEPPTIVFTGDSTTPPSATCTIDDLANPVCAALNGVLASYLGIAVVDAPATNEQDAIDWRETMLSQRIMAIEPAAKLLDADGTIVTRPMSPRIIGIGVRRDFEYEGRPFRAWANQPIYGIVGPSRPIEFNLTDGAVEGQDLLIHQVGVVVRGESGDDFAIADGGFVNLAFENLGDESIWQQMHKVRGRDFVELTVLRTLRYYLGKYNLTTQTIKSVCNVVGNILNICWSKQDILGYRVRFDPDMNNPDDLRSGKIYVDMRFEEAPMFRLATILSRPHRPALEATIAELTSSIVLTETTSQSTAMMPAA